MRKALGLTMTSLLLAAAVASAGTDKAVSHAKAAHGTIQSLDVASKTFVLRAGTKEMKVTYNDATRITGGDLKDGEQVELRAVEKNGEHLATAIQVEAQKPAKTSQ